MYIQCGRSDGLAPGSIQSVYGLPGTRLKAVKRSGPPATTSTCRVGYLHPPNRLRRRRRAHSPLNRQRACHTVAGTAECRYKRVPPLPPAPHDARSVAIAVLRSVTPEPVWAEDHAVVAKLWAKRQRDLARLPNKVACRLHSRMCELVAGGIGKEIYVNHAARMLADVEPDTVGAAARLAPAQELLEDLRRLDAQMKDSKKRLAAVATASGTTTATIFGVGPVIATTVIGITGDVSRFPNRAHFAAFNGTAPVEVSSGNRKTYRLSRRGNRNRNHAIHLAAITQISHRHSEGGSFYDRKIAEGKTGKEALRALKRRISDALDARMVDDARRAAQKGPGGQTGNDSHSSAAGSHPATPALRTGHSRTRAKPTTTRTGRRPTKTRATPKISRQVS